MYNRRWILPYRILNVKHDKKYFEARTNVHFLDLIIEHLSKNNNSQKVCLSVRLSVRPSDFYRNRHVALFREN